MFFVSLILSKPVHIYLFLTVVSTCDKIQQIDHLITTVHTTENENCNGISLYHLKGKTSR